MKKVEKLEKLGRTWVDDTLKSSENHTAIVIEGERDEIPQIVEFMNAYIEGKKKKIEVKRDGFGYSIDADHYLNNLNIQIQ